MDSILFSGCSYTYGEGLWRETGDTHQNSTNQKYLIENRWITKVSNHFNKQCISKQYNGGNNIGSIKYVMQEVDASTWNNTNIKLVIFQTTQFQRHEMGIDDQIVSIENMVTDLENKGIPVRFIHWVWVDITDEELEVYVNSTHGFLNKLFKNFPKKVNPSDNVQSALPPYDGNKFSSKIVRDRTIYILNDFNFDKMVNYEEALIPRTLSNKYTLAGKFKCLDFHMNQEGHDVLANEIINYIEKNKLL